MFLFRFPVFIPRYLADPISRVTLLAFLSVLSLFSGEAPGGFSHFASVGWLLTKDIFVVF